MTRTKRNSANRGKDFPERVQRQFCTIYVEKSYPRAGGAKRRARVLIPPGYLHPGKRKH